MTIARLRVELSGTPVVGPALMTFYSRNLANTLPSAVKTFLSSCAPYLASGLTMNVDNGGDEIDETTGAITGAWSGSGGGSVSGSTTSNYILGTGALVTWKTGSVYGGHHVAGRTFLVPAGANNFDGNGRLLASVQTTFLNAATALITAGGGDLVIWSRPRKANSGKLHNLPARAGAAFPITVAQVPLTPTSLRSRRT